MKIFKIVFFAVLIASFLQIGYNCSSDSSSFNGELDEVELERTTTRGMVGHRLSLVDSIAETDEFLEYMVALNSLFKKSDEYFSTLSEQERAMLESTAMLNNIEGSDTGVGYSDLYQALKSEMDMVVSTSRILKERTGYLRLNNNELNMLFCELTFIPKRMIKKDRTPENVLQKCEAERKARYKQAEIEAGRAMGDCAELKDEWDRVQCQGDVIVGRNAKWARADKLYKDCIKGK